VNGKETNLGVGAVAARGGLFLKYVVMFVAVVSFALAINAASDIWFSYQGQKALLFRIQRAQAKSAAEKISQFLNEVTAGLAWETQLSWSDSTLDEWQFDAVRLMHQVPALTEIAQLDATGREQFRMSREAQDVVESGVDHSKEAAFVEAKANRVYFGPVYFLDESQPYMTIAMAGARPEYGVILAQVNLTFIWDVVSQIQVGKHGQAYVVDAAARLIAHPDISLVLRQTDMSRLTQVQAARSTESRGSPEEPLQGLDIKGRGVLSAYAEVTPPGWLVFAELPIDEAYAPLYDSALRAGVLVLAALGLAFLAGLALARKMVVPIRALHDGAARVGSGELAHRISIETGDELEALGDQFNKMAARLQESHATLEGKVEERTRQLEAANLAKSRFLAAASHDLRQPLHAVGLFVAQLHGRLRADERKHLVRRIEAALSAMNELFSALLDISKLDSGGTTATITNFAISELLAHAVATFSEMARAKGLSLRVASCGAWVRSDFILLERVIFNLVSNALRYTNRGGLVVGCRKRGNNLRIEVWDTGIGIPADQHEKIFGEFYRLGEPGRDHRASLGLGLAIVDRACRLLNHHVEVKSAPGKGSVFAVTVPMVPSQEKAPAPAIAARSSVDRSTGKLVVVIDNDPLVLEGMGGILQRWGCRVITATADDKALEALTEYGQPPDLIISDYHLSDGRTGLEAIGHLRAALSSPIPAFLISGDTTPDSLRAAKAIGCHLLHKPVDPMALRAMFNQAIKRPQIMPKDKPLLGEGTPPDILTILDPPAASNRVH
jgi:signal transduction histidine kinase/ActR/RegA family two-component response regulator